MLRRRTAAAFLGLAFAAVFVRHPTGQTPELRVLSSNGVKAALEELQSQCERATGRRLAVRFNSSSALKASISSGETFDVVIGTSELLDALIGDGKIQAGSRAEVARTGIGVGVRAGASKPDVSTPDALRRTLVSARSVTYAQDGASRPHLEAMFGRFGIAETMKPKTILEQGSIRSTARVAQGDAELVLTLVSEILPIKGVELVGPLPSAVQNYVSFSAGVGATSADAKAAAALLAFLSGPSAAPIYKARGLEPR